MTQGYPLTRDELSELHGLALQLQAAGDPRAERVWKVVASQGTMPGFRVSRSPLKATSWLEDLEKTLSGSRSAARGKKTKVRRSRVAI